MNKSETCDWRQLAHKVFRFLNSIFHAEPNRLFSYFHNMQLSDKILKQYDILYIIYSIDKLETE